MKVLVLLFLLNLTLQGGMKIISNSFMHSQDLNKKFSCDGEKIIPHLKWSDFPKETKSFTLIMDDPDAPSGTFTHLMLVNIPVNVLEIKEGEDVAEVGDVGINSAMKKNFFPPCPPSGHGIHHYNFTIYALSIDKSIEAKDRQSFENKNKEHILAQATITGTFQR